MLSKKFYFLKCYNKKITFSQYSNFVRCTFVCVCMYVCVCVCVCMYIYIYISGGPLSALTCCVNARLLSAIKKISPLIYSQSWVGSWVYTTQAMMTFTLIF